MSKKKDIPLKILKTLEPFVHLTGDKFKTVEPKGVLLHILDIDDTSDFYFKIENYQLKPNGTYNLLMDKKPKSENENVNHRTWIEVKLLEDHFKSWVTLLEQYEKVKSFFDDPILKINSERFFQDYKIVDENADIEPFNLEQQLFLEEYLDKSKEKLSQLKLNQPDSKIAEIEILEKETEEIKFALTSESKNKIMLRLSKFWGRAQKTGLEIIKAIFIDVTSEIIKKLMIGQ